MSAPPPRRPSPVPPRSLARLLAPVSVLLVLGELAATPVAFQARSGHGDGMGDLGPLLLMLLATVPLLLGALTTLLGSVAGSRGVTTAGAVVLGLGMLLVLPVASFGRGSTTLVALLAAGAVACAGAAAAVVRSPSGTPPAGPAS